MEAAKEKIRLKFRVSAFDGPTSTDPKWTEKWGVGLLAFEEFHVTDQLLKLPFQENPPKTVCTFSVAEGLLRFKLLDPDRVATVNGAPKKESLLVVGDRIRIGETLSIEVLLAPGKIEAPATPGPAVGTKAPALNAAGAVADPAEGPTLIMTNSNFQPVISKEPSFAGLGLDMPEIQEPSVKTERPAASAPAYTSEPTAETVRPDLAPDAPMPRSGRHSFLAPEPKVELVDVPHAARDTSLDSREEGRSLPKKEKAEVEPFYADKASLDRGPTLSERLFSAVARVLKREDLNPPQESFPLDEPLEIKPWNPRQESEGKIRLQPQGEATRVQATTKPELQPWTSPVVSPTARLRGRALIFMIGAAGALMLAVGIFRIWTQVNREQQAKKTEARLYQYQRGVPLEEIEEKVRRMRRRQSRD